MSINGPIFYFEDGSGNWRTWRPVSRLYFGATNFKALIADLPNETFVDSSGAIDWASIAYFGMLTQNTTANTSGRSINIKALGSIDTLKVAGGGSNRPTTFADVAKIITSGAGIYRASLQGSGQARVSIPLQIGNGTDSTYFVGAAQSMEYQIGGVATTTWFRLGELDQPLTIYASAADTINLDNAIIATTTRQALTIHASSSTSAAYSFVGAPIVGWDVTWKTGINCTGAAFSNCEEIDAKGAQFTNCMITDTRSTDAAIAFDANSSMSGTTIDVTGTSAAYHLELGTAVTAFTLTNCVFAGTPATDKIHVKATTGTVTITLATGQDQPTYVSDGATVVFAQPQSTASITNIVAGSRLQIYNVTTATEVANEVVAGTTYSASYNEGTGYTSGDTVRVRLTCQSGTTACQWFSQNATANSSGWSVSADQETLAAYPSLGVDGSTVTEYSLDGTNVQVDANDLDGSTTKKRLVAWYYYAGTTEAGIRDFFRGVILEDDANAKIQVAVVDLTVDNISNRQLRMTDTDFRLFRDDGASWIEYPSTGGYGIDTDSGKVFTNTIQISGANVSEIADAVWAKNL